MLVGRLRGLGGSVARQVENAMRIPTQHERMNEIMAIFICESLAAHGDWSRQIRYALSLQNPSDRRYHIINIIHNRLLRMYNASEAENTIRGNRNFVLFIVNQLLAPQRPPMSNAMRMLVSGLDTTNQSDDTDELKKVGAAKYKELARKAKFRDCLISDSHISEVVVDVRSRVFRYLRTQYVSRPLKEKVRSLFRAMKDLNEEKKYVFCEALAVIRKEVYTMGTNAQYVFESPYTCPYKRRLEVQRWNRTMFNLDRMASAFDEFAGNILNTGALKKCINALESYMMSDLESVCLAYRGMEWMFVSGQRYTTPGEEDMFEADKACARSGGRPVLSEDFDCVALFGASMMIKEVHKSSFVYTNLSDVMLSFNSRTIKNLVEKCCIIGTDYNRGIRGNKPSVIKRFGDEETSRKCQACLSEQGIGQEILSEFFAAGGSESCTT